MLKTSVIFPLSLPGLLPSYFLVNTHGPTKICSGKVEKDNPLAGLSQKRPRASLQFPFFFFGRRAHAKLITLDSVIDVLFSTHFCPFIFAWRNVFKLFFFVSPNHLPKKFLVPFSSSWLT